MHITLWRASLLVLLFALSQPALAQRQWRSVTIPGAKCGDGGAYQVHISEGDPRKIAFDLMGGGACWSFATCIGPNFRAYIHPIPIVWERGGFVSDNAEESPAAGHTLVYFPYCTGDVHVGNHEATYGGFAKVHHRGKRNFELAIRHLQDTGLIDLSAAESFILYGYSAGAIGALFHLETVEPYLTHATTKVVLADSPGLHFGAAFWQKFSPEFLRDFEAGMSRAGMKMRHDTGNIASLVPAICRLHPDWRIGVLQGSRDVVMSRLFGEISPDDHESLVYSSQGIFGLTLDEHDNCSAWVPSTAMHTFLATAASSRIEASGKSAMSFAFDTVLGIGGANYR